MLDIVDPGVASVSDIGENQMIQRLFLVRAPSFYMHTKFEVSSSSRS